MQLSSEFNSGKLLDCLYSFSITWLFCNTDMCLWVYYLTIFVVIGGLWAKLSPHPKVFKVARNMHLRVWVEASFSEFCGYHFKWTFCLLMARISYCYLFLLLFAFLNIYLGWFWFAGWKIKSLEYILVHLLNSPENKFTTMIIINQTFKQYSNWVITNAYLSMDNFCKVSNDDSNILVVHVCIPQSRSYHWDWGLRAYNYPSIGIAPTKLLGN